MPSIALYQPDIPQNTGAILRFAACLGLSVEIVEPAGFDLSDRGLKRAGMDYLGHATLRRHVSFAAFEAEARAAGRRIVLFTTQAAAPHLDFAYRPDDVLLFGRESAGVPEAVHGAADARLRVPMRPGLRSLNLAMTVALVAGEALRQTNGFPAADAAGLADPAFPVP